MDRKSITRRQNKFTLRFALVIQLVVMASMTMATSADDGRILDHDPHYIDAGFFDMHICNWPERPRFFKILFSTEKFDEISTMEVFDPAGSLLVALNNKRYMLLKRKKLPEKRVYMADLDVPVTATSGWYSIKVTTREGKEYHARDYVPLTRINRVVDVSPPSNEDAVQLPVTLSWKKVPGAYYYKVYLRDVWNNQLLFESKLLHDSKVKIPAGKLQPGGYYSWAVHARDVNGHILLGDFHMGSMSKKLYFTVAE